MPLAPQKTTTKCEVVCTNSSWNIQRTYRQTDRDFIDRDSLAPDVCTICPSCMKWLHVNVLRVCTNALTKRTFLQSISSSLTYTNLPHFLPPWLLNIVCSSLHLHTRFWSRLDALDSCHTNTPTTDPPPPIHLSWKTTIASAKQEETMLIWK